MTEKPTLIFVPGAWHSPSCYGKVITNLRGRGYSCTTVDLATVNPAHPAIADVDADVIVISAAIEGALYTGKDVVLIVHSYGAIPGVNAAYAFKDRKSPGLAGIAMIASFISPPKTSLVALLADKPTASSFHKFDRTGHLIEVGGEGPEALLYNDLPPEEASWWATQLKPHTWISNTIPPSADGVGWQHVPTSYLICDNDQAVPPSLQRQMIDNSNKMLATMGSSLRIRAEVVQAGHSPFLSAPVETAKFIRRSAGEDI